MHKIIPAEALQGVLDGGLYYRDTSKIFTQLAMKNYLKMIQNYPHPIFFLNGANDEPNCIEAEKMLSALPTASIQIIEDAGHLVNLEQPAAFTTAIIQFAKNGARW